MGTNYYLKKDAKLPCEHCGRPFDDESLHIGKSSAGWVFSLHVIPEEGINSLDDWVNAWSQPNTHIEDEYGEVIPIEDMIETIKSRSWPGGLRRHEMDGRHCIGHGPGTWDCIIGEFS